MVDAEALAVFFFRFSAELADGISFSDALFQSSIERQRIGEARKTTGPITVALAAAFCPDFLGSFFSVELVVSSAF